MIRHAPSFVIMIIAVLGLSACMGPAGETPTAIVPTATMVAVSTAQPTGTPPPEAPTPTALAVATATPAARATPTTAPTAATVGQAPTPDPAFDNVFATILGAADAPPLWAVRPCAGDAPFLCILAGEEHVGTIELYISHLEGLEAPPPGAPPSNDVRLQELLRQQGLTPGAIDHRNPVHAPKIAAALRGFVDEYHRTMEQDRQITYGSTHTYTRLATEVAPVGAIPGVRYGFVLADPAGAVRERFLSFAAFDGTLLSVLVAHYDLASESSFRSDEGLRRFEPYLPKLVAGLRLPLPVEAATVQAVVTQGTVPVFRIYSVGGRPVAVLSPGQTLRVTGQSPNGRWWRVACPNDLAGECWVSPAPELTKPTTP